MPQHPDVARIRAALGDCRRVVVVGGPGCGKSTLAAALAEGLGAPLRSTDELIDRGWSGSSDGAADWIREAGPQVVEGVAALRGLRKMLRAGERPGVVVVHLRRPVEGLTPGQAALGKGCETVWREVAPELRRRGVLVLEP